MNYQLILAYAAIIMFGTFIHEMGHYLIAIFFNTSPKLHYGSCDWNPTGTMEGGKEEIYFTLGGILLPNIIAITAVATLYLRQKLIPRLRHFLIILGTFSFRGFFVFGTFLFSTFNEVNLESDETLLNQLWSLPSGTVEIVSVLFSTSIGLLLLKQVLKTDVPLKTYASSMVLGIVFGFLLWFKGIGPLLLP